MAQEIKIYGYLITEMYVAPNDATYDAGFPRLAASHFTRSKKEAKEIYEDLVRDIPGKRIDWNKIEYGGFLSDVSYAYDGNTPITIKLDTMIKN